jgi:hypothetical protein
MIETVLYEEVVVKKKWLPQLLNLSNSNSSAKWKKKLGTGVL